MLFRAIRLRCPQCGQVPAFETWFRLRPACPACGTVLERNEEGYRVAAYFFNLVLAEGVFVVLLGVWLVATWPDPPWTAIQYVAALSMVVAPFALYPISRGLFLAVDLYVRPVGSGEGPR